jgi:metallophosphoesterase superfamily enzyme
LVKQVISENQEFRCRQNVFKEDLQRLFTQILFFKAEKLIIAGDLSHSKSNKEMDLFKKWRNDLDALEMILINGNHDILEEKWYGK